MNDVPRPRRWFQFSLRSLLLVVLLVTMFFGGRASMQPAIQAERAKADAAKREAKEASRQTLVQTATLIRWVRISDELEQTKRRQNELERLRDAMDREEFDQRLRTQEMDLP